MIFLRKNISGIALAASVMVVLLYLLGAKEKDDAPANTESETWMMPSNNNTFRVDDCIDDRGVIFWRQYNNFSVGDSIYLYGTKPESRIKYLMQVEEIDITHSDKIDDKEYWLSEAEFNERSKHNRYLKLRLIQKIESDALSLEDLLEHGLKGAPQGAMRLSGELLDYIKENS